MSTSPKPQQQPPPPKPLPHLPPEALTLATTLFNHARTGTTTPLLTHITSGIPPNLLTSTGDTFLMLAAYHGHSDTVLALLEAGVDPNILNGRGQSALAGAVFKGFEDVVGVLWRGVGDVKADCWVGRPCAVDCARMFKREGMLRLFGVEGGSARPWEDEGGGDEVRDGGREG